MQLQSFHINKFVLRTAFLLKAKELSLGILFLLTKVADNQAQPIFQYNGPGATCHCEMVFIETQNAPKAVLVIDAQGQDLSYFAKHNKFVETNGFNQFSYLYLNVLTVGKASEIDCYERVMTVVSNAHKIKLTAFFLIKPYGSNQVFIQPSSKSYATYNTVYDQGNDPSALLRSIDLIAREDGYTIPQEVKARSDEEIERRMLNYQRNLDLGFYYTPTVLTGNQLTLNRGLIATYGLSFTKNITQQSAVKLSIGGSIRIPDPSAIQSSMQSKVMTAIQSGEDSLYIDETISGHTIIGWELGYRYYFKEHKLFRQYASIGIGSSNVMSISGRMQDTMDLSGIDLNNPSSMQNLMGSGSTNPQEMNSENMNTTRTRFFMPYMEYGIEYRLAPALKVQASVPVHICINQSNNNISTMIGLNLGISFTLNPAKFPRLKKK